MKNTTYFLSAIFLLASCGTSTNGTNKPNVDQAESHVMANISQEKLAAHCAKFTTSFGAPELTFSFIAHTGNVYVSKIKLQSIPYEQGGCITDLNSYHVGINKTTGAQASFQIGFNNLNDCATGISNLYIQSDCIAKTVPYLIDAYQQKTPDTPLTDAFKNLLEKNVREEICPSTEKAIMEEARKVLRSDVGLGCIQ